MKTLKQIGIMFAVALLVVSGANFFQAEDLSLGAVTSILGTDKLSDSRTVINDNFTDLDTTKMEMSTTTLPLVTTMTGLTTVGTIGTGVWQGTAITVPYGGTGSTTLSANQVLLGAGTSQVGVVAGLGTSGQFLTSAGAGSAPTWQSGAVDTTASYNWTGTNFLVKNFFASSTVANPINLNGLSLSTPSTHGTASTTLVTDGAGVLTWDAGIDKLFFRLQSSLADNTTYETVMSETIPGGTLGTRNGIRAKLYASPFGINNGHTMTIRVTYGTTVLLETAIVNDTGSNLNVGSGFVDILLMADGATNAQTSFTSYQGGFASIARTFYEGGSGSATEDSTGDLTLKVEAKWDNVIGSNRMNSTHVLIEHIR
jgi:hypothetical protein